MCARWSTTTSAASVIRTFDKAQHRKGMDKLDKERVKMMMMTPQLIHEVKRRVKSMKQTTVQKSKSKSKSKSRR